MRDPSFRQRTRPGASRTPEPVGPRSGRIDEATSLAAHYPRTLDAWEANRIVGRSPVDADTARVLAETTRHPLERILTHPVTGSVVEVDTYQRPASLDRYLRAGDRQRRFPGCRLPAVRCEVDHTHDHALGGGTRRGDLSHLCPRHHSMEQFTPWRVRQLDDGVLQWTSPLGRVTTDRPPPPVTFIPEPPDAPDDPTPF